ncbi:MAG: hypothetical protein RLZZ172_50 [Bacteroidota bacterium]|jgi:hypothetical protein
MKNIFKFLFVGLFIQSCVAVHSGSMSNSASLSAPNFSYVKQGVSGESSATYILGIGGLSRQTLVADAKNSMLKEYTLKDNQALSNLTVNFKTSNYFGVFQTVQCFVTADIVQFK